MGSIRKIYCESEYRGYIVLDEKRKRRRKVSAFYEPILEGAYSLALSAIESEMVRPEALMLSFAFTEECVDYQITKVIGRLRDKFRKVGSGRKKASTFRLRYLWVKETKFLTPRDPEYEVSLSDVERQAYLAASDECPIPYPHYHLILILDGHKATWGAVRVVMQELVRLGIVRAGFHFSENGQTKKKEMPLKSESDFCDYMYRAGYLAKIDTKDVTSPRFWSMSR